MQIDNEPLNDRTDIKNVSSGKLEQILLKCEQTSNPSLVIVYLVPNSYYKSFTIKFSLKWKSIVIISLKIASHHSYCYGP